MCIFNIEISNLYDLTLKLVITTAVIENKLKDLSRELKKCTVNFSLNKKNKKIIIKRIKNRSS